MDGIIFGFTDNAVVLLGAKYGYELDDIFEFESEYFDKKIGALLGAGIGNTISDFLGAILDPSMHNMVLGIVIGCLIPLFFIPFLKIRGS